MVVPILINKPPERWSIEAYDDEGYTAKTLYTSDICDAVEPAKELLGE